MPAPPTRPLLAVRGLRVSVEDAAGTVPVLHGVSLTVRPGETLALVGESGSGKSLTALSIVRLLPAGVRMTGGTVTFDGADLTAAGEEDLRRLRGARIGFVFQEPSAALSPVYTIGAQIAETLAAHGRPPGGPHAAARRVLEVLDAVGMPDPALQARAYPHQLSGGLRQRAMVAIALACQPDMLVADEPTTALDATLQADILALLRDLRQRLSLALLLITHDLGVVGALADRVAVMYAGRIVEEGPVAELLAHPAHPYTRGLLASIPSGPPGTRLQSMEGTPPRPGDDVAGCAFGPRCPRRVDACGTAPQPRQVTEAHLAWCHLSDGAVPSGRSDDDRDRHPPGRQDPSAWERPSSQADDHSR